MSMSTPTGRLWAERRAAPEVAPIASGDRSTYPSSEELS